MGRIKYLVKTVVKDEKCRSNKSSMKSETLDVFKTEYHAHIYCKMLKKEHNIDAYIEPFEVKYVEEEHETSIINLNGENIPIDNNCIDLVRYFNNKGMRTYCSCENLNGEEFSIGFISEVNDSVIRSFLDIYNKIFHITGYVPIMGSFEKWTRIYDMNEKIKENYFYSADTYIQADHDYELFQLVDYLLSDTNNFMKKTLRIISNRHEFVNLDNSEIEHIINALYTIIIESAKK